MEEKKNFFKMTHFSKKISKDIPRQCIRILWKIFYCKLYIIYNVYISISILNNYRRVKLYFVFADYNIPEEGFLLIIPIVGVEYFVCD